MKKRKVWRYTCDYCKKSGCSGGHIKRHEAACTNNPNRICRMHFCLGLKAKPMSEIMEVVRTRPSFPWGGGVSEEDSMKRKAAWSAFMDRLKEVTDGCPACILAALRQGEIYANPSEDWEGEGPVWDFKAAKRAFWEEVNEQNGGRNAHYCH